MTDMKKAVTESIAKALFDRHPMSNEKSWKSVEPSIRGHFQDQARPLARAALKGLAAEMAAMEGDPAELWGQLQAAMKGEGDG